MRLKYLKHSLGLVLKSTSAKVVRILQLFVAASDLDAEIELRNRIEGLINQTFTEHVKDFPSWLVIGLVWGDSCRDKWRMIVHVAEGE